MILQKPLVGIAEKGLFGDPLGIGGVLYNCVVPNQSLQLHNLLFCAFSKKIYFVEK